MKKINISDYKHSFKESYFYNQWNNKCNKYFIRRITNSLYIYEKN